VSQGHRKKLPAGVVKEPRIQDAGENDLQSKCPKAIVPLRISRGKKPVAQMY
jgi:hypothetical protein